jgi:hypothetical protein
MKRCPSSPAARSAAAKKEHPTEGRRIQPLLSITRIDADADEQALGRRGGLDGRLDHRRLGPRSGNIEVFQRAADSRSARLVAGIGPEGQNGAGAVRYRQRNTLRQLREGPVGLPPCHVEHDRDHPSNLPVGAEITHRERQSRPRCSHPDVIADQKPVRLERRHQIGPAAQRTTDLIGPAGADHGTASIRYRNGLFRQERRRGTVEECLASVSIAVPYFGGCGDQGRYLPDAVEDTRLFDLDRVAKLGRLRPHTGPGGVPGVEFIVNPEADRRQDGDQDRNEQAGQEAHLYAPKPCCGYRGAYGEMPQKAPPG